MVIFQKMVIEIVDLPIKHGDFPELCNSLPEGKLSFVLTGCFLVLITELGRVWQGVQAETFMSSLSFPKQTNTKEQVSSSWIMVHYIYMWLYVIICVCPNTTKKDLNLSISVVPTIKLSAKDRQQQGLIPRRGWAKFLRLDARAADVVYKYIYIYI